MRGQRQGWHFARHTHHTHTRQGRPHRLHIDVPRRLRAVTIPIVNVHPSARFQMMQHAPAAEGAARMAARALLLLLLARHCCIFALLFCAALSLCAVLMSRAVIARSMLHWSQ